MDAKRQRVAVKSDISTVDKKADGRLPVTVLSGFLGAGKTSVLQTLLHSTEHGLKIAVIVNDMAAVNVDAKAVVKIAPKLVAMQNGCICCTLREDLLQQVAELAKEKNSDGVSRMWDYLVIESTGISEPIPVAQTFTMEVEEHELGHRHKRSQQAEGADHQTDENSSGSAPQKLTENPLLEYARLDTMVTVVDACSFFDHINELEKVRDQADAVGDEDEERTLPDLMIGQVEFADVILLNKCDDLLKSGKDKELDAVEQLLRRLNATAVVIRTNYGKVSCDKILNTGLFDMEKAQNSAGWITELEKPHHTPETEEYGVSSMIFRARTPFHPKRLYEILNGFGKLANFGRNAGKEIDDKDVFANVMRSKGQIWLANAFACSFSWHSAGKKFSMDRSEEPFLARVLEEHLEVPYLGKASSYPKKLQRAIKECFGEDKEAMEQIETMKKDKLWNKDFGDRSQELVLIGVHLDKERIRQQLETALLTEEELGAGKKDLKAWKSMEDPFFDGQISKFAWDLTEEHEESEEEEGGDGDEELA